MNCPSHENIKYMKNQSTLTLIYENELISS